jgi:hypothetical protein
MPKKAAATRSGAQRNKPKTQKSFELVRPERAETEEESVTDSTNGSTAIAIQPEAKATPKATTKVTRQPEAKTSARAATAIAPQSEAITQESQITPPAGSASARLAARRQAAQKQQQREATSLITSEHFAYVRKDLMRIAIFAVVMFTAIIVLYLTFGRA